VPFARGPLYCLLKNPVYAGQLRHHEKVYSGQHEALLPPDLWEQVQAILAENGAARRRGTNVAAPSLLAGRISDGEGRPMVASHATKGARRYRYYISAPGTGDAARKALRLPAGEVEMLVRDALAKSLGDSGKLFSDLAISETGTASTRAIEHYGGVAEQISSLAIADLRELLDQLDLRVRVDGDRLSASYIPAVLGRPESLNTERERITFDLPGIFTPRGHESRLVFLADQAGKRRRNARLVALLVRSFTARGALIEEPPPTDRTAANARKSYLSRLARMSYLAPDIVQAILDGTQPRSLGAREMLRTGELPVSWAEQRLLFGFWSVGT
jgi:site-specific DNA recombinase